MGNNGCTLCFDARPYSSLFSDDIQVDEAWNNAIKVSRLKQKEMFSEELLDSKWFLEGEDPMELTRGGVSRKLPWNGMMLKSQEIYSPQGIEKVPKTLHAVDDSNFGRHLKTSKIDEVMPKETTNPSPLTEAAGEDDTLAAANGGDCQSLIEKQVNISIRFRRINPDFTIDLGKLEVEECNEHCVEDGRFKKRTFSTSLVLLGVDDDTPDGSVTSNSGFES